jgi:hypothetical protein
MPCCISGPRPQRDRQPPQSAASHEQLLTSLAVFGLLGEAAIALPGFAPQVAAGETSVLTKSDRLEISAVARNCSQQVWPRFDPQCLHSDGSRSSAGHRPPLGEAAFAGGANWKTFMTSSSVHNVIRTAPPVAPPSAQREAFACRSNWPASIRCHEVSLR